MTDFEKSIKRDLTKEKYLEIRDHNYSSGNFYDIYTYGKVSSWFVWNRDDKGRLTIWRRCPANKRYPDDFPLDWDKDANLPEDRQFSKKLTTDIVFLGLNMAGNGFLPPDYPLFENARCHIRIIKIFFGTKAEGGYFTDIFKPDRRILDNADPAKAVSVMGIVKKNPDILKDHIQVLKDELDFIGAKKPLLIVFGNDARYSLEQAFERGFLDKSRFYAVVYTMAYFAYPKGGDLGYTNIVSKDLAPYITIPSGEAELTKRWEQFGIK